MSLTVISNQEKKLERFEGARISLQKWINRFLSPEAYIKSTGDESFGIFVDFREKSNTNPLRDQYSRELLSELNDLVIDIDLAPEDAGLEVTEIRFLIWKSGLVKAFMMVLLLVSDIPDQESAICCLLRLMADCCIQNNLTLF